MVGNEYYAHLKQNPGYQRIMINNENFSNINGLDFIHIHLPNDGDQSIAPEVMENLKNNTNIQRRCIFVPEINREGETVNTNRYAVFGSNHKVFYIDSGFCPYIIPGVEYSL